MSYANVAIAPRSFSSLSSSGSPTMWGPRSSLKSAPREGFGAHVFTPTPLHKSDNKETMKNLNEKLAGYISKVQQLEISNSSLENQIKELLLKKQSVNERDWSVYEHQLRELRKQVSDLSMENVRLLLDIDNAKMIADDFKAKFEQEKATSHCIEKDLTQLRKVLEEFELDIGQLEKQAETKKEELEALKENHKKDVASLRAQIPDFRVIVKKEDLKSPKHTITIAKIREQYEKDAQVNNDKIHEWLKTKSDEVMPTLQRNTEELQAVKHELSNLLKIKQALEFELQAMHDKLLSLQDTLNDTERTKALELKDLNGMIQRLTAEQAQGLDKLQQQAAEYQHLLNTTKTLEADIDTYRSYMEKLDVDEEQEEEPKEASTEDH